MRTLDLREHECYYWPMKIKRVKSIALGLRLVGACPGYLDGAYLVHALNSLASPCVAFALHLCRETAAFKLHWRCVVAAKHPRTQLRNAAECNIMQHISSFSPLYHPRGHIWPPLTASGNLHSAIRDLAMKWPHLADSAATQVSLAADRLRSSVRHSLESTARASRSIGEVCLSSR